MKKIILGLALAMLPAVAACNDERYDPPVVSTDEPEKPTGPCGGSQYPDGTCQ